MNIVQKIEQEHVQKRVAENPIPEFAPGDTVKVLVKVKEGTRERVQAYEGLCLARKNAGINSSFTVRKISYGEGVERVFPLHSPNISIEVSRRGSVRRAKLYYLRELRGKKARISEKTRGLSDAPKGPKARASAAALKEAAPKAPAAEKASE